MLFGAPEVSRVVWPRQFSTDTDPKIDVFGAKPIASVRTDVRSDVRAEAPRRLAPLIVEAPRRLAPLWLCAGWRRGGWLRARDARNKVRLVLATCFFFSDAVVAHAV